MTRSLQKTLLTGVFLAVFALSAVAVTAQEDSRDDAVRTRSEVRQRVEKSLRVGDIDAPRPIDPSLRKAQHAELMRQTEERRAERLREADERRTEIEARMMERETRRAEFRREIAERRVENAKRVISATIERLSSIADRVESRIDKVTLAGGDTSEAETYLAAARADLQSAEESVARFDELDLSSDNAQTNFELIRAAAEEAKGHIRSAHQNLAGSVSSFSNANADKDDDSSDEDEEVENETETES